MMVKTFANFRFVSVLRTAASSLSLVACVLPTIAQPQDSDEINIVLPNGGAVVLQPFIHHRKAGVSDAQCGVVIDQQVLTLIGSDETEAYSCVRLVEAGPLPPLGDRNRIGLIYDVASPNARFRTASILIESASIWGVHAPAIGYYDDRPEAQSLTSLAEVLATQRH